MSSINYSLSTKIENKQIKRVIENNNNKYHVELHPMSSAYRANQLQLIKNYENKTSKKIQPIKLIPINKN